MALTEALKAEGYRITGQKQEKQNVTIIVHAIPDSGNNLLAKAITLVKVVSFNEILPSMNDIFKFKVQSYKV